MEPDTVLGARDTTVGGKKKTKNPQTPNLFQEQQEIQCVKPSQGASGSVEGAEI